MLLGITSSARADAVLSVVPTGPVIAGQTFTVAINITGPTVVVGGNTYTSGVTDLASFQFDLGFNCMLSAPTTSSCTPGASILQALSVTEGSFLPNGGSNPTFFEPGSINNTAGEISLIGDVGLSGVSGSGTIVDVTFEALETGMTDIAILANSDLQLYNSNFSPIVVDNSVTSSPGTQTFPTNQALSAAVVVTPEPPSVQLLLLGGIGGVSLLAFARYLRRETHPAMEI